MRRNGQYMKKYSGYTYDDLQERIVKDWDGAYSDCRIVAFSMERDVALVHALVVFEEMGLHHFGRYDEDWSDGK